MKIDFILEHIKNAYGFESIPCSIPKDDFQSFKRNIYIFIYNRISKKLFYFLRDKISPIKYLDKRPNRSLWFQKRNSEGKVSIEVEIIPISHDACIYYDNDSGLFKKMGENFKVEVYIQQKISHENVLFLLNHINGIEQVDYYFSKVDELKKDLRDWKLKDILK
jgi:hypothetical protein